VRWSRVPILFICVVIGPGLPSLLELEYTRISMERVKFTHCFAGMGTPGTYLYLQFFSINKTMSMF
jgi:hypothetical protein